MLEAQVLMSKMLSLGLKLNSKFLLPFFKNPIGQMLVSFGVGYFVTTKLSQIYIKWKGNSSEFPSDGLVGNESLTKVDIPLLAKESQLVLLTTKQLAAFNGLDPDQPVYTALNGRIYDLSTNREKFCSDGPYSILAGGNANQILRMASGCMDFCEEKILNYCEQSLRAEFNIVGYLINSDEDSNGEAAEWRDLNNSQTEDDFGEQFV